jgi:hypothetical protein
MTAKNEAIIPLALRQSLIDTMKVQLSTDVQVASLAVKVSGAEAASSSTARSRWGAHRRFS